jgi:hypothetical protein
MSLIVIICIGYLFNENSEYCLIGKSKALNPTAPHAGPATASAAVATGAAGALSTEEQMILKSLTDKAEKFRASQATDMVGANSGTGAKLHQQYQKIIENLLSN